MPYTGRVICVMCYNQKCTCSNYDKTVLTIYFELNECDKFDLLLWLLELNNYLWLWKSHVVEEASILHGQTL